MLTPPLTPEQRENVLQGIKEYYQRSLCLAWGGLDVGQYLSSLDYETDWDEMAKKPDHFLIDEFQKYALDLADQMSNQR